MPPVSGAEMLRFLIESQHTTQSKVATGTGISESTISEVLAGKRELNRKHIEALAPFSREPRRLSLGLSEALLRRARDRSLPENSVMAPQAP